MIAFVGAVLSACSGGQYKIKSETSKVVNTVPKSYMADFDEKEACDLSIWTKQDDDKLYCIETFQFIEIRNKKDDDAKIALQTYVMGKDSWYGV